MIIFFALMGKVFSNRYSDRIKTVEEIILMLQMISSEISFCKTPIKIIIEKLCEHKELQMLDFIFACRENLKSEEFPEAWKKSLEKSCLKKTEKDLLLSFGANLGVSDVEGQISNCELHKNLFENVLLEAREKYKQSGKLCTALGIMTGCLIFVVFI